MAKGRRILISLAFLNLFLPHLSHQPGIQYKESEVKGNVWIIYTALQRYFADRGEYPIYLWGGRRSAWEKAVQMHQYAEIPDPLIRFRYLKDYPNNPFITNARGLCQATGDPRFGCDAPTSVGAEGTSSPVCMANILSDYRIPDSYTGKGYYLFAGDASSDTKDFIPGMFGYRRLSPTQFVLFVYGSIETKGLDLLSEQGNEKGKNVRSLEPPDALLTTLQNLSTGNIGNPDTYPDGIILVLTEQGIFQEWKPSAGMGREK